MLKDNLRTLLGALLLGASLLTPHSLAAPAKPNLLFILADDLGQMDIGAFNPKTFYETPNINALARRGMKFTQGYAACSVCSPTRGSIMTGKYPPRFGITNFIPGGRAGKLKPAPNASHLPLEEVTLAESLRDAGYTTFFAGKWHLGGAGFMPKDQGFTAEPIGDTGPKRAVQSPDANADAGAIDPKRDPKRTDLITQEAVKFIEQNQGRPFFAYLPFNAPHVPIGARADLVAKWQEKAKQAPADAQSRFQPEQETGGEGRCQGREEINNMTPRSLFPPSNASLFPTTNAG